MSSISMLIGKLRRLAKNLMDKISRILSKNVNSQDLFHQGSNIASTNDIFKDQREEEEDNKNQIASSGPIDENKHEISSFESSGNEPSLKTKRSRSKRTPSSQRVYTPFIELDTVEGRVDLVVPEQEIPNEELAEDPDVSVQICIDGVQTVINLSVEERGESAIQAHECRKVIESPFKLCSVNYPLSLKLKEYRFIYFDKRVYLFEEGSQGRAKLFDLYKGNGTYRRVPRKHLWILLREDLHIDDCLVRERDERFLLEDYHLMQVDLRHTDCLELYDESHAVTLSLPTRLQLRLEGNKIDDDMDIPAYTSKLTAHFPENYEENVYLLLRSLDGSIEESFKSTSYPELELDTILGKTNGIFQIDVTGSEAKNDWETLVFRWLSSIEHIYRHQGMCIPIEQGHTDYPVHIKVREPQVFLYYSSGISVPEPKEDCYKCIVDRDTDEIEICVGTSKANAVPLLVFRPPRLRWRRKSNDNLIHLWQDTTIGLDRRNFQLTSNDFLEINFGKQEFAYPPSFTLENKKEVLQLATVKLHEGKYLCSLNQFYDTVNEHRESLYCILTVNSEEEESRVTVATIEPIGYSCRWCAYEGDTKEDVLDHVTKSHMNDIFEHLTYEELQRRYVPHLPKQIYQCNYCKEYVESVSRYNNPTNAINDHQTERHPYKRHSFRIVSDAEEIRRSVNINLPHIYRCKLCGKEIKITDSMSTAPLENHLHKAHFRDVWD